MTSLNLLKVLNKPCWKSAMYYDINSNDSLDLLQFQQLVQEFLENRFSGFLLEIRDAIQKQCIKKACYLQPDNNNSPTNVNQNSILNFQ